MMATITETATGFIAGDPPATLTHGHHRCDWCDGSGIEYGFDDDLIVCGGCSGACQVLCSGQGCEACEREANVLRKTRLEALCELCSDAVTRHIAGSSFDPDECDRLEQRAVMVHRARMESD